MKKLREKLLLGADKLSDTKLLAILLRVGSSGKSAVDMARELMQEFGTFKNLDSKILLNLKEKDQELQKLRKLKQPQKLVKDFSKKKV